MTKIRACVAMIIASILLVGCSPQGDEDSSSELEYPFDIVVTTGMIGDIVSHVVGDRATVQVLMGEEVDPHLYRPTRADISRMQNADIIFYNGLLLEGRMGDSLIQLARSRPVYAVSELIDESRFLEHEEYEQAYDPHLWMDVSLWIEVIDVVEKSLSEFDPAHTEEYRSRATEYQSRLSDLDEYVHRIMATIPEERRYLITAHDAFGYFGDAYRIDVIGVQGISTESEAGLEDINSLVRFVVDNEIEAIFAESTVPDRALSAVIEGAASRGHETAIGGKLYSDAMGPAGSYEGTYIGMIDHNATTIVRSLGGDAPATGWHGRLSQPVTSR